MKKRELLARIEELEREIEDLKARLEAQEAKPWPWSIPVYPTWPIYPPVITYDDNTTNGTKWIRPQTATA